MSRIADGTVRTYSTCAWNRKCKVPVACRTGLGANIRKAEYEKLQSYSFSNIDHFRVSSLVTRLTSDVTNIQNSVSTGMRPFGRSPVMLIFASSIAFTINRTLALVFFVALPILATLLIIIIMKVRPLYGKMQNAIDLVNRSIQENLTAIRVVKSYVRAIMKLISLSR